MAITRPAKNSPASVSQAAADAFVAAAIEQPSKPKRALRGKKTAISLTLDPVLLDDIDALAIAMGTSRAGAISMAISRSVLLARQEGLLK